MSDVSAGLTVPVQVIPHEDAHPRYEDPGRAFANGILLALPLWGLIGLGIWAIL